MSTRLQVVISDALDRRIRKAAQRRRQTTGAWVRQALERELREDRPAADPVEQLQRLGAPTADIDQMLAEIEAGRG
jgi:predicted transcriptional regulator